MDKLKTLLRQLLVVFKRPELRILPGNLAFFLVLSIIPIITLIGFIASYFSISIASLIEIMKETLPKDITNILIPFIDGKGIDGNVIVYMVSGFIVASNGAHSIILSSNILYHQEHSDFVRRRIKSFFLTILLVNLFFFVAIVLAFGNTILKTILDIGALKNIGNTIYYLFVLFKWPIAFFLIFITIKLIYTMAPDIRIPSKYVNKGAIFTTIGWSLITAFYSYYVENFTHYDIFYGSLSNIIVMMMWIYILAYVLVIGIAMNANLYDMEKSGQHNLGQNG